MWACKGNKLDASAIKSAIKARQRRLLAPYIAFSMALKIAATLSLLVAANPSPRGFFECTSIPSTLTSKLPVTPGSRRDSN